MMTDREKIISTFEKIISVCKEDGCDFVDLSFEDAEQILALLKEQKETIDNLNQSVKYEAEIIEEAIGLCESCKKAIEQAKERMEGR